MQNSPRRSAIQTYEGFHFRKGGFSHEEKAGHRIVIVLRACLIYFERTDDTQFGSVDVAIGKARTAVAFRRPTKALEDPLNAGQYAILSFPGSLPREGGLPILQDGKVVGAIGVSGGKSSEDAQVAKAGVDAYK